ncbi:hypothetical protein WICPIJ_008809 [Wickerhamomyces pijperi]|uniref:Uncharacterized protein n=1 Tax=Wickerhamomyces pijperi TaxID=599730 RepID=A0A9P8PWI1_WICPI|nr:hypothetical protein WICPIJ_008809 [Wickerhamomyces pijperi]
MSSNSFTANVKPAKKVRRRVNFHKENLHSVRDISNLVSFTYKITVKCPVTKDDADAGADDSMETHFNASCPVERLTKINEDREARKNRKAEKNRIAREARKVREETQEETQGEATNEEPTKEAEDSDNERVISAGVVAESTQSNGSVSKQEQLQQHNFKQRSDITSDQLLKAFTESLLQIPSQVVFDKILRTARVKVLPFHINKDIVMYLVLNDDAGNEEQDVIQKFKKTLERYVKHFKDAQINNGFFTSAQVNECFLAAYSIFNKHSSKGMQLLQKEATDSDATAAPEYDLAAIYFPHSVDVLSLNLKRIFKKAIHEIIRKRVTEANVRTDLRFTFESKDPRNAHRRMAPIDLAFKFLSADKQRADVGQLNEDIIREWRLHQINRLSLEITTGAIGHVRDIGRVYCVLGCFEDNKDNSLYKIADKHTPNNKNIAKPHPKIINISSKEYYTFVSTADSFAKFPPTCPLKNITSTRYARSLATGSNFRIDLLSGIPVIEQRPTVLFTPPLIKHISPLVLARASSAQFRSIVTTPCELLPECLKRSPVELAAMESKKPTTSIPLDSRSASFDSSDSTILTTSESSIPFSSKATSPELSFDLIADPDNEHNIFTPLNIVSDDDDDDDDENEESRVVPDEKQRKEKVEELEKKRDELKSFEYFAAESFVPDSLVLPKQEADSVPGKNKKMVS